MHRFWALRPSPAMVVALLALFVSLGGSAYAAFSLPRNSVGTRQLTRGAVTSAKLRKGAIGPAKIKAWAVTNSKIADGAVTNGKLANSSLRINAGHGLLGGGPVALGSSGALSVNPALVQSRMTGACPANEAISSIAQGGGVGCMLAGARDIGAVTPGTTPVFRPEGLRGWRRITHQVTGSYCLTADPSSTTQNSVVLVSSGNVGGGQPGLAVVAGTCGAPNSFAIDTYAFTSGGSLTASDSVGFTAVIPN